MPESAAARQIAQETIHKFAPQELPMFDDIWAEYGNGAGRPRGMLGGELRGGLEVLHVLWTPLIVGLVLELSKRAVNAGVDEIAKLIAKRKKGVEAKDEAITPEIQAIAKYLATEISRARAEDR